jgi:DNA polymerase-3 subunit alpha
MEKFAGYGFNKSHAAAYSLLAYHTAWLKVHYTAEFFCANMTVEMDDTDKLKVLFEDALKLGMAFEPPDVNRGVYRFEPVSDKSSATAWAPSRAPASRRSRPSWRRAGTAGGPFTSLFDFCVRVDRTRLNKRTVEALIKAGAFDNLHRNRAALVASIDRPSSSPPPRGQRQPGRPVRHGRRTTTTAPAPRSRIWWTPRPGA